MVSIAKTAEIKPSDIEVATADQVKINKFAVLNGRAEEISSRLTEKKKELQNINDVEEELILLDDEEPIPFQMGQIFVDYSKDQLESKLKALKCSLDAEIGELQSQHEAIKSQMQQLKTDLYGKFGNSINLEPVEDD